MKNDAEITWQFSTGSYAVSWIVRFGTRCDYSHVDAVLPDGTLLGSQTPGGVQIRPPDYQAFTHKLTVKLPTTQDVVEKFYAALKTQIGKPYDYRALIAFGLGDREWRSDDRWFCSELQIWALEQADFFEHPLLIQADRISPRDHLLLISPWIVLIGKT